MTGTAEERVKRRVLAEHQETVAAVCEAGQAVATSWPEATVSDNSQITGPMACRLDDDALPEQLLKTVETAADALDCRIDGSPVPAPPYYVVTSRGPTCRVTLEDGRRLVLLFDLFAVERRPRTYSFRDPSPDACLQVRLHE